MARRGEDVALVTDAGTPLVSDPGARLVSAVIAAGHGVVPVPGPSAALAALVASGLPAEPFTFYGFLARSGRGRTDRLDEIAALPHTAVLYESPARLVGLLEELSERSGADRRVAVARELTKIHEEVVRGTLPEVASRYRDVGCGVKWSWCWRGRRLSRPRWTRRRRRRWRRRSWRRAVGPAWWRERWRGVWVWHGTWPTRSCNA
jgi:16S rRNA (cytidine(1402)-2'-O)-methyltransferase